MPDSVQPANRFLTLADVAQELATSVAQVTALVHRGELRALKLGGRGQWRVSREDLESFIADAYEQTARQLEHGDLSHDETSATA